MNNARKLIVHKIPLLDLSFGKKGNTIVIGKDCCACSYKHSMKRYKGKIAERQRSIWRVLA